MEVATILSIGAGEGGVWDLSTASGSELREAVKRATMSCEPVHEELYSRLRQTSIYFRLNVERGSGPQMELSSANVSAYLEQGVINDRVDEAVKSIHLRPMGVKLKDISEYKSMFGDNAHLLVDSVTVIEVALKPRPSLVDNFVGREDVLEAMRQTHLTQRARISKKSAITVLSGLGGAGKTQTALKFALEFEEK
jgi:Mrp family chromosome partitioning ATPase